MKKIKMISFTLFFCGIGIVLGILITIMKSTLGITSDYISGAIIGTGIVTVTIVVNALIKRGKLRWLTKKEDS